MNISIMAIRANDILILIDTKEALPDFLTPVC